MTLQSVCSISVPFQLSYRLHASCFSLSPISLPPRSPSPLSSHANTSSNAHIFLVGLLLAVFDVTLSIFQFNTCRNVLLCGAFYTGAHAVALTTQYCSLFIVWTRHKFIAVRKCQSIVTRMIECVSFVHCWIRPLLPFSFHSIQHRHRQSTPSDATATKLLLLIFLFRCEARRRK